MAREPKRGCGYRKVGGLYMVSGKLSQPCGRLPLELHVCPTCQAGIKQTRAWQWIRPRAMFAPPPGRLAFECKLSATDLGEVSRCSTCPLAPANLPEKAGLLWVGEKFYPTVEDFSSEANALGVSRRIPAIPRNFKLGETWVLIAHPKAITRNVPFVEATEEEQRAYFADLEARGFTTAYKVDDFQPIQVVRKGVVTMFKPTAIEKLVTETQSQDAAAMAELAEKGITPVVVPDDDPDHQGSVHDKADDESGQLELPPLGNGPLKPEVRA